MEQRETDAMAAMDQPNVRREGISRTSPLDYARPVKRGEPMLSVLEKRVVLAAAAVASIAAGTAVAYVLVVGFGLGDSWLIYPPDVPLYAWAIPIVLVGWPLWFGARWVSRHISGEA